MNHPKGCMKQIHQTLERAFANKPPRLSDKWKAMIVDGKLFMTHYHHLVLIYELNTQKYLHEWHQVPADKRGLDSAKVWLKAYHKELQNVTK